MAGGPVFWASLSSVLAVLSGAPSSSSWALLSATLAVVLLAALLQLAGHRVAALAHAGAHPDATARDERCRRGAFRRQTQPDARGRRLPRAPQAA